MRVLRLAGVGIVATALLGCANQRRSEPPAPAASESRVMEIRQTYQRNDPKAQVGVVVAVDSASKLAAVGQLSLDQINEDDVVTFIDSDEQPIANGIVVRKTADYAHVKFDPTAKAGRAPVDGDIVVKF